MRRHALAAVSLLALLFTLGLFAGRVGAQSQGASVSRSHARLTGQTAAVATVLSVPVGGSDCTFLVSANANVTSYTSGTLQVKVVYTDETNTSNTVTLQGHFTSGYGVNVTGTGAFEVNPIQIRAKAGTNVVVETTGTLVIIYNVEALADLIQ